MNSTTLHIAAITLLAAVWSAAVPAHAQTEKVLYTFSGGADGADPYGGVIMDKAGSLYGTTTSGGSGHGVVFRLSSPYGQGSETILYTFSGGDDGDEPGLESLIMDKKGNIYGTTIFGGADGGYNGYGVVYEITP